MSYSRSLYPFLPARSLSASSRALRDTLGPYDCVIGGSCVCILQPLQIDNLCVYIYIKKQKTNQCLIKSFCTYSSDAAFVR
ncbi:hypothetical protein FKM82_024412 [Ascaphus truei]